MGLSRNYRNFPDILAVMDEAVKHGGVRLTLESDKAAVVWRMKAYHVRKLVQKNTQAGAPTGMIIPTPYDGMHITLEGATVVVKFVELRGTLAKLDGTPITSETKRYEEVVDDELTEAARQVKKGLFE